MFQGDYTTDFTFATVCLYTIGGFLGIMLPVWCCIYCFHGPGFITIYYKISHLYYLLERHDSAPLIVESEYFPRPRYDGYCLLAEEDPQPVPSTTQDAEQHFGQPQLQGLDNTAGIHFPRGILTHERERLKKGHQIQLLEDSIKSVSFNLETEIQGVKTSK